MLSRTDLPRSLIVLLRAARTALLRAAGPAERLLAPSRRSLPPLWLRRHAGPVRHFVPAARQAELQLAEFGLLVPDAKVLDLGCGPGAMVPSLQSHLGPAGCYVGVDVHEPSIRWCRRRFRADRRFRFEVLERESPYKTSRGTQTGQLPVATGSVRLVIAKSLFTHVLAEESAELLAEIRRVLDPEHGRALVTAFLFDAERNPGGLQFFPHPDQTAAVRWRLRHWPHAAVAYDRELFEFLGRANDLVTEAFLPGYWPGGPGAPSGQDALVLGPARGRGGE